MIDFHIRIDEEIQRRPILLGHQDQVIRHREHLRRRRANRGDRLAIADDERARFLVCIDDLHVEPRRRT